MSDQQELFVPKSKHRAIHMPVLVLSSFAFALIGLAAFFGVWKLTFSQAAAAKREIIREENEAQKAQRDALVAEANDRRNELLHLIRETTNYLTLGYLTLTKIGIDAEGLKTNKDGLFIAKCPDLVNRATSVFTTTEEISPSVVVLVDKLETARRLDIDLQAANGSASFPESALCDSIQQSRDWALSRLKKITELDIANTAIVLDARTRVSFVPGQQPNSRTLQQTIMLPPAPTGIPGFHITQFPPAFAYSETRPSKSYIWITQIIADDRLTLREKALNPRVQEALAPFLSVGTYYPGGKGGGYAPLRFEHPRPMSYKRMQVLGALGTDEDGLLKFVDLATDVHDDRPRLRKPFHRINWDDDPELRTEAQLLQSLFFLVAPTYVDLGMLDP